MNKPILPDDFDENPEWTEEMFAQARPASEVFPPEFVALLVRPGRPVGSTAAVTKQHISLRLDRDVVEHFRASGPGWQSRINQALRRAMG